jgi:hypothetical protein
LQRDVAEFGLELLRFGARAVESAGEGAHLSSLFRKRVDLPVLEKLEIMLDAAE